MSEETKSPSEKLKKTPVRRGRKPKVKEAELPIVGNEETNVGESEYVHVVRDENASSDNFDFGNTQGEFESEGIPTSYSTSEDDLKHDNYSNTNTEEVSSNDKVEVVEVPESGELNQGNSNRGGNKNFRNRYNRNQQGRQNSNNRHNNQNNQGNQNRNQQGRQNSNNRHNNQNNQGNQNRNQQGQNQQRRNRLPAWMISSEKQREEEVLNPSGFFDMEELRSMEGIGKLISENFDLGGQVCNYVDYYELGVKELQTKLNEDGIVSGLLGSKNALFLEFFKFLKDRKIPLKVKGVLDVFENDLGGALCFAIDSYKPKKYCVYVPVKLIKEKGLIRGQEIEGLAATGLVEDTCLCLLSVELVMGESLEVMKDIVPFNELTPYYPTQRIIMEASPLVSWDNLSMRVVDLLTPIGLGQRALIVAPPRTGKTVLMQGMANSIRRNMPDAHLIILLVDERPEEVTDFKRNVDAEVIASTFDEEAFSHVHAAEMVISRARRMVERGKDVVILLDSITRLARAYNAMMPNGGRTMSGGVEANALQKPKRFFGSARNIEGGGSLTIIGTALIETGSKMDEVIFEEFKGTGNLELHLDRSLSDKRIFPAINIEKSGTRKEEMLYHQDEMNKIYTLRRAFKGVGSGEAMEMLIQRLKKVKTNIEFLLNLNR